VPVTSPEVDALTAASAEAEPVVTALVNSCGVVKWFNQRRGFGFIGCHEGPDVFVHHSAIVADFGGALEAGQHVAFEIGRGRQGDEATRVRLVAASGGCG